MVKLPATAQVTITQPEIQSLLAVSLQMLLVLVKLMDRLQPTVKVLLW
jgi:hypothetical protein